MCLEILNNVLMIINSHMTFKVTVSEYFCPCLLMDLHLYSPLSSDLIFEMLKILPDLTNFLPLNQLKFRAGGFESLVQFRVTESPSTITPDGLMDTETLLGGS